MARPTPHLQTGCPSVAENQQPMEVVQDRFRLLYFTVRL